MGSRTTRAGFVLVGGNSTRMGTDKASLHFQGATLVEHIAAAVAAAAGNVTLIGPAARYRSLGLPVIEDRTPGLGPLGGLQTALAASKADWNLVVACDMPVVSPTFLGGLMAEAETGGGDCLIPEGPTGRPEPLCAAYHARCLPAIEAALARGVRKMTEALAGLKVVHWRVPEASWFRNVNTPEDWTQYLNG